MLSDHGKTLAHQCARVIFEAFRGYNRGFLAISRRARDRFIQRQWHEAQADTVERIDLYDLSVQHAENDLENLLGEQVRDVDLWALAKDLHSEMIASLVDSEFNKTFFSSVTRRIFKTIGVDPRVEYLALDVTPLKNISKPVPTYRLQHRGSTRWLLDDLLSKYNFGIRYRNIDSSVRYVAKEVDAYWELHHGSEKILSIEAIQAVFYQGPRAYIVGRIDSANSSSPFVLALKNSDEGILVDAVLLSVQEASILFSFTRWYFHVDLETVGDAIVFLRSILPSKQISELYTVMGRAKQGKTERYRNLEQHLSCSQDKFIVAPGEKGMVMAVFLLPSFDIVFKVIRDKFAPPKTMSRREVMQKYALVFKHDRAGRLVDAQEFRRLEFPVYRFDQAILDELLNECGETCHLEGENLVLEHCYVERRMTPLNLYLKEAEPEDKRRAVVDYGQAIRDLAASNIFPGDLLLKNFGVTRNGRVIFYDYDELCLITECRFRDLPRATSYEDEMRADAWFFVGDDDVFPEQFINFLGLDRQAREIFLDYHHDLLTADYWRNIQTRLKAGEMLEVVPYFRKPTTSMAAI
ncbi:MAG: bifunctional isocitrate dehydrogenase kinase/phosphatase [Gammaproteobacteria bacterium]|nr:bifunctional isocitrate dehydrogenase kinase/phosphatase [Gammaproteobacteria bacterium]